MAKKEMNIKAVKVSELKNYLQARGISFSNQRRELVEPTGKSSPTRTRISFKIS